jgi:hypothetical protein
MLPDGASLRAPMSPDVAGRRRHVTPTSGQRAHASVP